DRFIASFLEQKLRRYRRTQRAGGGGGPTGPGDGARAATPSGGEQAPAPPRKQAVGNSDPSPPPIYCDSWVKVLTTLGLKNDRAGKERARVRQLNDKYEGPIIFGGQGTQPFANRAKLLAWYERLEQLAQETAGR